MTTIFIFTPPPPPQQLVHIAAGFFILWWEQKQMWNVSSELSLYLTNLAFCPLRIKNKTKELWDNVLLLIYILSPFPHPTVKWG